MIAAIYGSVFYAKWYANDCKETRTSLPIAHIMNAVSGLIALIYFFSNYGPGLSIYALLETIFHVVCIFLASNYK